MNHGRLSLLIWYLLLTRLHVDMFDKMEFNAFVETSDLKELCPYSQFCGHNASARFPRSDNYRSCCWSCSCDHDCGLRRDCCSSQLDQYRTETDMICRHLFAVESAASNKDVNEILNSSPHYRMVNKCSRRLTELTTTTSNISCEHRSSDSERLFQPVFSPTTKFIYINSYCALCNNVSNTVPLRRAITCFQEAEPFLNQGFDIGKISNDYSGCLRYYIPPADVSDTSSCYPNVIRQCNTTGNSKVRNQFWDFCETFNATFTYRIFDSLRVYANIYCFRCNEDFNTFTIKKMECEKQRPDTGKSALANSRLTILLDTAGADQSPVASTKDKKMNCPANSVMVTSFQKMCRPVECPSGKLLIKNRCDYYSSQWIGGPFAVMLRLSPLRKDTFLHISFFTDMSLEDKYDSGMKWLSRNTLKRWKFLVMYHLSNNQHFIEYIVVKAEYPSNSVNPSVLNRSVKNALVDIWKINYKNSTIPFKLEFNEYSRYYNVDTRFFLPSGINITQSYGLLPIRQVCYFHKYVSNDEYYDLLLIPFSDIRLDILNRGMFITKLFFCSQVDLLSDEYHYTRCGSIFFKVKNIPLHVFSTITLPNVQTNIANVSMTSSSLNRMAVRVCIHEFEQSAAIATAISMHILGICAMILYTI